MKDSFSSCLCRQRTSGAAQPCERRGRKAILSDQALAILKGIYDNYFIASDDSQAMISCGTVNYAKKKHVNVPIIYGDYFSHAAEIKRADESIFKGDRYEKKLILGICMIIVVLHTALKPENAINRAKKPAGFLRIYRTCHVAGYV